MNECLIDCDPENEAVPVLQLLVAEQHDFTLPDVVEPVLVDVHGLLELANEYVLVAVLAVHAETVLNKLEL